MAGKIQGDKSGNILVEFDYNNIIVVDPNKTIKDGKISERLVDHEKLVMFVNLEAEVVPRTKLSVGGSPQDRINTISVAKINFLKPTAGSFLTTDYYDELTGKGALQGNGANQSVFENIEPQNGDTPYTKQTTINNRDNGLLGITSINVRTSSSFIPSVSITLEDVQGRALFQLGDDSPYAAFFNLPYCPFYLTLKGYYGQAIRYQLNLTKFNASFNSFSGNYLITLEFVGYKYNILNEVSMGHLLATPHMYGTTFDVTKSVTDLQQNNKNVENQSKQQGAISKESTVSTKNNVIQITSEKGYQKIVEVYSEYKSKALIPLDFPELTLAQLINKLDVFEKSIINSYSKVNVEPLTNIRTYKETLQNYFLKIRGSETSWFNTFLNQSPIILNTGDFVYTFKENIDDTAKESAKSKLKDYITTYNNELAANETLGAKGKFPIKNSITYNMIELLKIPYSNIDFKETLIQRTRTSVPTQIQINNFENTFNKTINPALETTIGDNGQNVRKLVTPTFFIFEGINRFDKTISQMETEVNKKLSDYETALSADLAKKIENTESGLGFKPSVRNIIAIIMASAEGFIRLLDDVHTNAWNVKYDPIRRNAILDNPSSAQGSDTVDNFAVDPMDLINNSIYSKSQIPVYPWPQFFVETSDDKKGRFELKYIADPSVVGFTHGSLYSKWPEVEFVEEYMKGLTQKFFTPIAQPPTDDTLTTNIININAIEYPQLGIAYVNKEEIKFFYEIWERQFLTAHYSGFIRANNNQLNQLINLNIETESSNIVKSLGISSPYITMKLKSYPITADNYVATLESISNQGTGRSYQEFIRDFFVTPYIRNITENSFSILSTTDLGKIPQNSAKSEALQQLLANASNTPLIVDTYPFTDPTWTVTNMSTGNESAGNSVYNTNQVLQVFNPRNIIANFDDVYNYTKNRPVTNFSYLNNTNPSISAIFGLDIFYNLRSPISFVPTEGYCDYQSPTNLLPYRTTTSILNTPYFINSIQNGVDNFRGDDLTPYVQSAYLFLNSLPLASLRERYKSLVNDTTSDLDYIASCFNKFGAIHKMPYAWIVKLGSVWYRYKKYKESGVDILDSAWTDFDYKKNYSPVLSSATQTYSFKLPANSKNEFPKPVNITLQSETQFNVDIQTGFYPKLINDFNVFYNGYDLYVTYTDEEIQNSINNGLKLFNFADSNISGTQNDKILSLITWSVILPDNIVKSDICIPKDNTKGAKYFIMPSFGSPINQTKNECLNISENLVPTTVVDLTDNKSMYNGSVRLLWAASNYGYFDNSQIVKPEPDSYLNFIDPTTLDQTPMSLLSENTYSKVEEIFSVFDKTILDQFEQEFLNFSKPSINNSISKENVDLNLSPVNNDDKFKNFQILFTDLMSVTSQSDSITELNYFNNLIDNQIDTFQTGIELFLNYDVILRYGNPSNYKRRIFDSYISQNSSAPTVINPIVFNPYVKNSLPSNGGTVTLSQSKLKYPSEWIALETEVGFSTIPKLIYTNNGSFITDFFILNDIEFSVDNIVLCTPLIKMFATQKLQTNTLNSIQFKNSLSEYLTGMSDIQNDILNAILVRIRKDLPIQDQLPERTIQSVIDGQQSKVETYEVFKALNDKWIAGSDFKAKTLFEDIMFLDRASRNIGDTLILDIFDLKKILNQNALNMEMSVFVFISGLLIKNNFTVMPLPAYVNFYNVQDVSGTTIRKAAEGSLDFADKLWGTFNDVDYRDSSPKLICFYVGKPSNYLALPKGNFRFRDDSFDMRRASENPLIENMKNKTDYAVSNRCVGFNVDIGIRNQNIFYSFNISQEAGKATSESINAIVNMSNMYSGRNVATQNNGLYNLYKQRSYKCSVVCLGNALLQPTMYFNLRHVPMFNGPYMITDVQHTINSGSFQTTFTGVRQGVFNLPVIDSYLQSINQNLLTKIEAIVKTEKDAVTNKSTVNSAKSNEVVLDANNQVVAINSCTSNLNPFFDTFVQGTTVPTNLTPKELADIIISKTSDANLQFIIYLICYIRTFKGNTFYGYDNNIATITLTEKLDSLMKYVLPVYSCINIGNIKSKKMNSQPTAHFETLDKFISFMVSRLSNNVTRIIDIGFRKYYVCFWPTNNVSEKYYEDNLNEYVELDATVIKAEKSANSVGIFAADITVKDTTSKSTTPNSTVPKNNINTTPAPTPTCPPPTITSISPKSGSTGTIVIIKGTNLEYTTLVKINNVNVVMSTLTIIDSTAIRVSVPSGISTLVGNIVVTTSHGQTTPSDTNKFTFKP